MFEALKSAKMLREHEDALARVDRRLTALEVQWMDTLDRLKQMMGRVLKERQRAEAARGESESREGTNAAETVESLPGSLSERQQQITAQILARRNRTRSPQ